jgi:chorismate synthase
MLSANFGEKTLSANSFGQIFKISSFGESHGPGLGVLIDGCPAGVTFREEILRDFLQRRKPGGSAEVSARAEDDSFEILSGVFEGRTLGTPIAVLVRNRDQKSADYEEIKTAPRAGHADDVWRAKFDHSDHRGGGRSSGRETLARVIGGAFAKMLLTTKSPTINASDTSKVKTENSSLICNVISFPKNIGPIQIVETDIAPGEKYNLSKSKQKEISDFLVTAKSEGQSYGGVAEVRVTNVPANLGQPVFHKFKSDLAAAMMSIGATAGFELGEGFAAAQAKGTEFHVAQQYGGIRGGITTGEPITFRIAFKPTSSILDVAKKGRHDPCIVLRALAVVEAMTWLVIADHYLWARLDRA